MQDKIPFRHEGKPPGLFQLFKEQEELWLREFWVKRLKLHAAEGVVCGKQPEDLRQVAFLLLVSVLHGTASFVPAALWFLPQVMVVL